MGFTDNFAKAEMSPTEKLTPLVLKPERLLVQPWHQATIVLMVHDKWFLVFYKEGFQLPAQSQHWEMMENAKI